jgi:hypothetical protein
MDDISTAQWVEQVWKPHVDGQASSFLLWDDYSCHKTARVAKQLADLGTDYDIIPGMVSSANADLIAYVF